MILIIYQRIFWWVTDKYVKFIGNKSSIFNYKLLSSWDIGSEFKTTMNQKKIFLKDICKKFFPKSFDFNRKQGFSIPLADWLINDNKIKDLVFDNLYNSDTVFNKEYVNNIYNGLKKGYSNSEKIFCLLQFEIWRKKNKIKNEIIDRQHISGGVAFKRA